MYFVKMAFWTFSVWMLMLTVGYAQAAAKPNADGRGAESQSTAKEYEKLLRDADELLKNGKAADAYILLSAVEFENSGEERFDYMLGVAALDSGKPDKATLAFERVLMVNPNFTGARLDMARAYYQLGDLLRARTEFETVLHQNPSDSARATIQKYLDAISTQETGKQTQLSGYAEGTVGRDNNVNNATDQSQVSVPALGNIVATLSPTNLKTGDNYYGAAAGGEVVHRLNPGWSLYAGADLHQRGYHAQKSFDSLGVEGRVGAVYGMEADRFRVGMTGGQYTLGSTRNRNTAGFNAEWGHTFSPGDQLNIFGQYLQYRFADIPMQVNDFNQQAVGAGWVHVLGDGKSMLSGSLYFGTEKDVSALITPATPNGGRTDGAKRFNGLRFGGQSAITEETVLFASAGWQAGDYSRINPYFLSQRTDRLYDLMVGAGWRWDKLWTVRPQVAYARNKSNIVIYSYNRTDVSVTLRRDFK